MSTQLQWLTPPPLWQELSSNLTAYRRPAILRFATDTFMQDLQSVLQTAAPTLRNYVAAGENWKAPAAGIDAAKGNTLPFKLYQPTHQRFYLIASSLTCRKPGLPDHTVNTSAGESVGFVVRQLRPNSGYTIPNNGDIDYTQVTEYAWIPSTSGVGPSTSANGSSSSSNGSTSNNGSSAGAPSSTAAGVSGTQPGWMQASFPNTPTALAPGEELIPLSQTQFASNGISRRLYIGLIPASRRQQYVTGITLAVATGASVGTNGTATTSGSNSSGSANSGTGSGGGSGASGSGTTSSGATPQPPVDPRIDLFHREIVGPWHSLRDWWKNYQGPAGTASPPVSNDQTAAMCSALILSDFATYLSTYLPDVWNVMTGSAQSSSLQPAELTLFNKMTAPLQQAIVAANTYGPQIEQAGVPGGAAWPPTGYSAVELIDAPFDTIKPMSLQLLVANALPPLSSVPAGVDVTPLPPLAQPPADPAGTNYFIIRCVYRRPQCMSTVISPPSQQFLLTNYFDSDAPARRIQVALPVEATAAGLRKYDKGVAFNVSQELRNQMARVANLNALSNGSFNGPGVGLGWICSFSIPIITICAFILLFCIVIALNLIFFWIPFFKICFPVPTVQSQGSGS